MIPLPYRLLHYPDNKRFWLFINRSLQDSAPVTSVVHSDCLGWCRSIFQITCLMTLPLALPKTIEGFGGQTSHIFPWFPVHQAISPATAAPGFLALTMHTLWLGVLSDLNPKRDDDHHRGVNTKAENYMIFQINPCENFILHKIWALRERRRKQGSMLWWTWFK